MIYFLYASGILVLYTWVKVSGLFLIQDFEAESLSQNTELGR